MTTLFVHCRRLPILCLILSSLVAWPDDLPLAPIASPCAVRVGVEPGLGRDGKAFDHDGGHHAAAWDRGLPALDDGEEGGGRPDDRAASTASGLFAAGLPSLIPPSAVPVPSRPGRRPGASAHAPPLRC